jgi:hypothetical protein
MRKLLLAGAATLGASAAVVFAQNAPNPSQGQYIAPLMGGPSANNNNNTSGTAQSGVSVAPAPGTVVIRLNGRVYAEVDLTYGSGLQSSAGTISNGATTNASGYKLNPVGVASFLRLYPGIDGTATNGMRYGASVEIRENFEGGNNFSVTAAPTSATTIAVTTPSTTATSGTNASASGVSSAQTLFVRRAFVYFGSDRLGIIRLGQGDGLGGNYNATNVFTIGTWDGGIANINFDGGFQGVAPSEYIISWAFLVGSGPEYANNKIVYLSPSFYGVDVGIEFGPSQGNALSNSSTSSPYQVGPCNTASANCITVTSGTDESRWINRWGFGGRFIETFAGATVQGYGEYIVSGHAENTSAVLAGPTHFGTGAGALKYDGQSMFNGGLAVSYFGITVNTDLTVGRTNGANALDPTGGVPVHAELAGLSYAFGKYSIGAVGAIVDSQGSANLVGTSQRHEFAVAVGGAYRIAPGINLALEYQYVQKHQGDYNFNSTAIGGGTAGNDIHGQGLTLATIVNW